MVYKCFLCLLGSTAKGECKDSRQERFLIGSAATPGELKHNYIDCSNAIATGEFGRYPLSNIIYSRIMIKYWC